MQTLTPRGKKTNGREEASQGEGGPLEDRSMDSALPGVSGRDPELVDRFEQARKTKGDGYRPRTKHLRPDGRAKYTNRLFLETSPYLLQHAPNPVDWYPWGDAAGVKKKKKRAPPGVGQHGALPLPLVPCHGGGVVRGRGDRPVPERTVRRRQGGPGGATGRGRHLHESRPGLDRARGLAVERLADAGPAALPRRGLFSPPGRPLGAGERGAQHHPWG